MYIDWPRFLIAWLSDKVSCQYAVLQYMFSFLYISKIASSIEQQGMHGIQLLPGLVELIVLFDDDIALISNTPKGLHKHLNVISSACKHRLLNINL